MAGLRPSVARSASRYDAFLSYSHAVDGQLAPALQSGLQRLARPFMKPRALKVFRDKTSLSASPHLWGSIESALMDSKWFVLLASPEAAASTWVNREVKAWRDRKSTETILLALTDGTWAWNPSAGDFDWERSTSIPTALAGGYSDEPLYVDFRWARSETDLSIRHTRFRDAVADVAASIHGIPKEELESEDVRQHRRTRRFVRFGVSLLVLLALTVTALAVIAKMNADRALQQARLAVSRELAVQSEALLGTRPDLAALLAVEAHHTAPTFEALDSLVTGAQHTSSIVGGWQAASPLDVMALNATGTMLATGGDNGRVVLWDVASHRRIGHSLESGGQILYLAFNQEGSILACAVADGYVVLWKVDSERRLGRPLKAQGTLSLAFSFDGKMIATAGFGARAILWNVATQERLGPPLPHERRGQVQAVAFSPDGRTLAAGAGGRILVWDIGTRRQLGPPLVHSQRLGVAALAFNPDGTVLASGGVEGRVILWDIATHTRLGVPLINDQAFLETLAYTPDGQVLVAGWEDGRVLLWSVANHRPFSAPLSRASDIVSLALSHDGKTLATGGRMLG
jgi:WD40 repeat protein